jgi:hypothetical protein
MKVNQHFCVFSLSRHKGGKKSQTPVVDDVIMNEREFFSRVTKSMLNIELALVSWKIQFILIC